MRYYLRNRFRSSAPEETVPAQPELPAAQSETEPRARQRKRCGFCREEGHIVTFCNSEVVSNGKIQFLSFIEDFYTEDAIDMWLNERPIVLLRAIACSYRIMTFHERIGGREMKDRMIRYILSRQARNILLFSAREELENRLHRIGTWIEMPQTTNIYDMLSIKIENHEETPETIQCPVCYDEVNENKRILNCGHGFCEDCTEGLLKNSIYPRTARNHAKCPMCREQISVIKMY